MEKKAQGPGALATCSMNFSARAMSRFNSPVCSKGYHVRRWRPEALQSKLLSLRGELGRSPALGGQIAGALVAFGGEFGRSFAFDGHIAGKLVTLRNGA